MEFAADSRHLTLGVFVGLHRCDLVAYADLNGSASESWQTAAGEECTYNVGDLVPTPAGGVLRGPDRLDVQPVNRTGSTGRSE